MINEWQMHEGGHCPVPPNTNVRIRQRDGWEETWEAGGFGWKHRTDHQGNPWAGDIVAWRLFR